MSVRVMTWVWEHSQAKGHDRLVLLAIADNANNDGGNAFPGHPELMRKTLLSRSTVYDCIERLIASGELERETTGGGRGRRTVYRVTMANRPDAGLIPDEKPSGRLDGLGTETVRVTDRNSPRSAGAYKEVEPSRNRQDQEQLLLVEQARPVPANGQAVTVVFDTWKASTGKQRAQLDNRRRGKIQAALKAYPLADVLAAVQGWKASPYHRGENTRGTVYNELDLLLRDASHIETFRDLHNDHSATTAVNGSNGAGPSRPWLDPDHDPDDLSWLQEASEDAHAKA